MRLGEPDASGRRRPEPVAGSEFLIEVDTVIMALGTSPNPLLHRTTPGITVNRRGCIIADEATMATEKAGVYAGGDAVTGAATVILPWGQAKQRQLPFTSTSRRSKNKNANFFPGNCKLMLDILEMFRYNYDLSDRGSLWKDG